jgi:hypothetical protein
MISIDRARRGMGVLTVALLALALGGCAVQRSEVDEGFSGEALTAQGTGAGIPVQVDGVVGNARGAALAASVTGAMPTEVAGTAVHYAACEPYQECPGDHVVWTFGPPSARSSWNYPAAFHFYPGWIGSYEPGPNHITAIVALFQGDNVVATADGQVDAPNGADDPAFRAMIDQMSRAIFSGPGLLDGIF